MLVHIGDIVQEFLFGAGKPSAKIEIRLLEKLLLHAAQGQRADNLMVDVGELLSETGEVFVRVRH